MAYPEGRILRERLTRVEFLVTLAILVPVLFILLDAVPRAMKARGQRVCQAKLKRIGQVLQMYVEESKEERFPLPKLYDCEGTIQPWSGAMDLAGVHPEYMTNLDLLVCPAYGPGKTAVEIWDEGKTTNPRWEEVEGFSNNGVVEPCEVLAKPYYYYGWAFSERLFYSATRYENSEPEDLPQPFRSDLRTTVEYGNRIHNERFAMAIASLAEEMRQGTFDAKARSWEMRYSTGKPLELPRGSHIPALMAGAARLYMNDINNPPEFEQQRAKIVVLHEELFDTPEKFYHGSGRMNTLYMDGHVESLTRHRTYYGIPFPFNEAGFILHDAVEGILEAP